jgi:ribosomal protein RSM22 (predicted rRNA methylase)
MQLPSELRQAIEEEAARPSLELLKAASESLSRGYRASGIPRARLISSENDRIAYLATRLPATYAAARRVAEEIIARIPGLEIESLLDLGAGPGTASWACSELFEGLGKITLVERDPDFIELGKRLARRASNAALREAKWRNLELSLLDDCQPHDAVFLTYVVGEVPAASLNQIVGKAWARAEKVVAIVEPGTPAGFSRVLAARQELISLGAVVAAPCPHQTACPMSGGDWCHFSARVERTSLHRRTKHGTLPYEDEKYSYVVAARCDVTRAPARVIRHPAKLKGHVRLELCTVRGIDKKTIARKNKEQYRAARKSEWGSAWLFGDDWLSTG